MRILAHILLVLCILALSWGRATWAADLSGIQPIQPLTTTSDSGLNAWRGMLDSLGRVWIGIYPTRHHLALQGPTGTLTPLVPNPQSAPSGLALAPGDEGRMWVAYRSKAPKRGIFVIRSDAPETVYQISGDSLPLARVRLMPDGQGGVHVLWYDESPPTEKPWQSYWLWFNHLSRDGHIGTPERVLPGIYPLWLAGGAERISVFSWYWDPKGSKIGMRLRDPAGAFRPEVEIAQVSHLSPPLGTFVAGTRWFVYWVAQYGVNREISLIEGVHSDDQGATWQPFSLKSLRGLDVRGIEVAADGSGNIALAITGHYRGGAGAPSGKLTPYLVTSHDNGNTWETPLPLQPKRAAYSQAPNAKVAFVGRGEEQRLVVAAEDWRSIRPRIRYWLSADGGRSWPIQDRALPVDPAFNYQLSYRDVTIYEHQNTLTFLLERLEDDLAQRTVVAYNTSLSELNKGPTLPATQPDLERLKARVNAYGKALIERDYQAAYELFDPFYRARVDFLGHLKQQGRIAYTTAEFVDAEIQEHIATVQFHIVASIIPSRSKNQKVIGDSSRDVTIPARWVWVAGEWYMEYYSEGRDLRFTRY